MIAECELVTDLVRCTVLMLLYGKSLHGYAILEVLNERLGRAVSPAIVYPFLSQMMVAGYLVANTEHIGKRTRVVYSLTPKGRMFSRSIFKRLSQMVSTAVESNMLHCAHCGCRLYEAGHAERINGRLMSFCCVHCAKAYTGERM